MDERLKQYFKENRVLVFIGEAGSGKTEISVNLAMALAKEQDLPVHFFDMDQTKTMFRARDVKEKLEECGVTFHYQYQNMDAPVVASGVIESINDSESFVILDVGGGQMGSYMIGQFAAALKHSKAATLYVFNPYRAWSKTIDDIIETQERVLGSSRLSNISLVANPNLGLDTTKEDVLKGLDRVKDLFPENEIVFTGVWEELLNDLDGMIDIPVVPIKIQTLLEWMKK